MPLEVIGAGFGRTGTLSLRTALVQLGFDPCYHMFDNIENADSELWLEVEQAVRQRDHFGSMKTASNSISAGPDPAQAVVVDKLRNIFDHGAHGKKYRAAVDFPASVYYKELLEAYPDAKVVLSIRDCGDKWYDSACETIASRAHWVQLWTWSFCKHKLRSMRAMVWECVWGNPRLFRGKFQDRSAALDVYDRWITDAKECVAPRKVLVFNVKEGWQPLCTFLDVPVPETPFPHVNETADFKKMVASTNWALAGTLMATAAVAVAGTTLLVRVMQRRGGGGSGA